MIPQPTNNQTEQQPHQPVTWFQANRNTIALTATATAMTAAATLVHETSGHPIGMAIVAALSVLVVRLLVWCRTETGTPIPTIALVAGGIPALAIHRLITHPVGIAPWSFADLGYIDLVWKSFSLIVTAIVASWIVMKVNRAHSIAHYSHLQMTSATQKIDKLVHTNVGLRHKVQELNAKISFLQLQYNLLQSRKQAGEEPSSGSISIADLRRILAKELHPDLTTDPAEKIIRERLFKAAWGKIDALAH